MRLDLAIEGEGETIQDHGQDRERTASSRAGDGGIQETAHGIGIVSGVETHREIVLENAQGVRESPGHLHVVRRPSVKLMSHTIAKRSLMCLLTKC